MGLLQYNIIKAGTFVLAELDKRQELIVLGVTSRGVFLKNSGDRIIFISQECYCSPLTILIEGNTGIFRQVNIGSKVMSEPGGLHFLEEGIYLKANTEIAWTYKDISIINPEINASYAHRLAFVAKNVVGKKKEQGFSPILGKFLNIPLDDILLSREQRFAYENIQRIKELKIDHQQVKIKNLLESMLGLGRGLTPSGDDLIIGFLLALVRWKSILDPNTSWVLLEKEMVLSAYIKTTLISANLIEAASYGMGDERLMDGLDGIMCGNLDEAICATNFNNLGNSSGADALLGIYLASSIS